MTGNTTVEDQLREALDLLLAKVRRDAPHLSGKLLGFCEAILSLPTQAADAETCLACNGRGEVETGIGMLTCDVCHGSGVTQPASKPAEGGEAVAHIENGVLVYCALPVGFTGPLYTAPPASQEQAEPAEQEPVALLRKLGPKPWETSPEAYGQMRLIQDFVDAYIIP